MPHDKPENFNRIDHVDMKMSDSCAYWEEALVDLLDGTLAPERQAAFTRHAESCAACRDLLRDCGQGREWIGMLHDAPPAIPPDLLGRILSRTGTGMMPEATGFGLHAVEGMASVLPLPVWASRGQRQARILMTAAMAVFSIGLTLSITGTRLGDVRVAMANPAALQVSAFRQFFDTKKQVVSFYDNLRLVREVEATVQDLRQSAKVTQGAQPERKPGRPQPSARALPAEVPLQALVTRNTSGEAAL